MGTRDAATNLGPLGLGFALLKKTGKARNVLFKGRELCACLGVWRVIWIKFGACKENVCTTLFVGHVAHKRAIFLLSLNVQNAYMESNSGT